jgi:small subunit ribosomal protein S21
MIKIKVKKNESIDKALKRFKKKFRNTKVVKELKERQKFEKKSDKRRNQIQQAKYNNSKKLENDEQ